MASRGLAGRAFQFDNVVVYYPRSAIYKLSTDLWVCAIDVEWNTAIWNLLGVIKCPVPSFGANKVKLHSMHDPDVKGLYSLQLSHMNQQFDFETNYTLNMTDSDEEREIEELVQVTSMLTPRGSMVEVDGGRRVSRASFNFFQQETAVEAAADGGLIGRDGKLRDEYIVKRQSVNKPATLTTIPLLADLTTDIHTVDGWCLTQLLLAGYAKMSTKIDELNKINVFPIADGTYAR